MDKYGREERIKLTPDQKKREADAALAEYRAEQKKINENMQRLRAERMAREATTGPTVIVPKKKKAKSESLSAYIKRESDQGRKI
jgi:hypothetical protein